MTRSRRKTVVFITAIAALAVLCSKLPWPGRWHFDGWTEVRAYRLNWAEETAIDSILSQDGALNPTRTPEEGIPLTTDQVRRLEKATTGRHPEHQQYACHYPHHAFVFFDSAGSPVGFAQVCFLCGTCYGRPEGFSKYWDLDAIKDLVTELGMPISNPDWH